MSDHEITDSLTGLVLSADELKAITDWDDRIVEDYLALVRNIRQIAGFADIDAATVAANTAQIILNAQQIGLNVTAIGNNATQIGLNVTAIALNTLKQTNVSTNLSVINQTITALTVASSDGSNAILPQATTLLAGLLNAADKTNIVTLTNASNADLLHKHSIIQDATAVTLAQTIANVFRVTTTSVVRFVVDAAGNLAASFYQQGTRDDGTVKDEKVLTTDANGNVLLRTVLPYSASLSDNTGGVSQLVALTSYMTLNFTVNEAGDYILDFSYVWSLNASNRNFLGRILLDGATIVNDLVHEPSSSAGGGVSLPDLNGGGNINTGTDQRFCCSGFSKRALAVGAHTLEILIGSDQASNEAAIYSGNLKVTRDA